MFDTVPGSRPARPFLRTLSPAAWVALVLTLMSLAVVFCGEKTWHDFAFMLIFTSRYLRLIVHMVAYWLYVPATRSTGFPKFSTRDTTIILPTIDPTNPNFMACLTRLAINLPEEIIVVTAGQALVDSCLAIVDQWALDHPDVALLVTVRVEAIEKPGKRNQVAHVVPQVQTPICVSVDDCVIWGPNVLQELLTPFDDPNTGFVGTNKRVTRDYTTSYWHQFWNFLGAVYLERHNFEIRATNAIDGGVFVISGRTAAIRTEIVQTPEFLHGLTHEMFFFGLFGPLGPDDDNYISRWVLNHGWTIKIQYTDEARIETRLGEYPRFLGQCERWVRATPRSNMASLFSERTCWTRWPWTTYAAFITSLFNFAALYDSAMLVLVRYTTYYREDESVIFALGAWIVTSKLVKLMPHFVLHPRDVVFFLAYCVFAWYHSWLKLWALLTFYDDRWSGRKLGADGAPVVAQAAEEPLEGAGGQQA